MPTHDHLQETSRRLALGLLAAGLLAGCASRKPAQKQQARKSKATRSLARRAPARPTPATRPPLNLSPGHRESAVAQAMLLVNTPYTYGGNTPQGGFDCSGLIHYIFAQLADSPHGLPRSTAQWAATSVPVTESGMQRGDLVFFNTTGRPFSHMGLYVGGDQFVHAPSSGGTVRRASLGNRYFASRYLGARRVFAA